MMLDAKSTSKTRPTGTRSRPLVVTPSVERMENLEMAPRETTSRNPRAGTLAVTRVRGLDGLKELRGAWRTISTPWASPMQSHEWIQAWAEVCGVDRDLDVLVAGNESPTAIAPLVRSPWGRRRWELAGPHQLGEVMDFLYADPPALRAVAGAIAETGTPIRFWRLPADSPVIDALKHAYRGRGLVQVRPSDGCPSLPLDETWAEPEKRLDSKPRANVRRARRIAERMGPVTVEILTPKPENVQALLQEAFAVEVAGWKARSGTPLVADPLLGKFFERYATGASEQGNLRVCFLRIGGRPAAMKLAAITGNRFWLLAMGFSDEFEQCSPGTLLLLETIRYAARCGLRSYEFLGADEGWIRPWTQLLRPCVSLRTYPLSVPGTAALLADTASFVHSQLRKATGRVRQVPRSVERRVARAYVAGPGIEDAVDACRALGSSGLRGTIGFVSDGADSPRVVAKHYAAMIEGIADRGLDCYVSIKADLLDFSPTILRELAERALKRNVGLHFDALGPEAVDPTFAAIREAHRVHGRIGCTLPSRWVRSLADAEQAIEMGLGVRVVRGEFADRREREVDPWTGFLQVIDRLAARAPRVAVATHDPDLARESLRRLRATGTACELEVLLGYPIHRVLPIAHAAGVPVRVYVPFGAPSPPYSLSNLGKDPRVAWWTIRDLYSLRKYRAARSPGITERYVDNIGAPAGAR